MPTNRVGSVTSRDVRAQESLDTMLDMQGRVVNELEPDLLLDPYQPGAQRLGQECLVLLLEAVVA